ncbi:NAD-dependent epimerase/dehydratase family protein [Cyclobacterium amurskyense]|uniref:UDP-glucose 4-epimerase n=1 Tax=Cyclobacterium amurskyense TaxID=320787 RepID=A0A0H4PDC3_9BACT|nr:NAD-dependent epimerase/dehydratase family protein [Cyclobacterium amurskyense]AKP52441.1 UDP-glucose 4-epimerase [Cyclobacterium amurskyense]
MSDKILITGISGFVGQNLYEFLNNNGKGDILSLSRSAGDGKEVLTYEDFFADSTVSASHYVHLAGKAHDLKKTSDDQAYFDVNFGLTKKLYDRFLADPEAKNFVFISSVKACADTVEGWLTEETKCDPVTPYGKSKLQAEEYILKNLPADKQVYILRPCMIHGPGNKGNLNLLFAFAKKGLPFPLAAFDNQRSFLSVDNLCWVILQLLNKDIPSGVYQVADEGAFSTNQLIRLMAASLNKRAKLWAIPASLITACARVGDKLHLPLTSERLKKLTESYKVDNSKIVKSIGEPLPMSAETGLKKTFKAFI